MASMSSSVQAPAASSDRTVEPYVRRQATLREESILTVCVSWLIGGLLLDAWAHGSKTELESFFTPWHAVMYAGGAACAGALGWMMLRNIDRGASIRSSVPAGYDVVALGVVGLGASGIADMMWHITFGIERDLPVFFSPSHITLVCSMAMIAAGPWARSISPSRLGDRDPHDRSWAKSWPAVVSVALVATAMSVITGFADALGGNVLASIELPPEMSGFGIEALLQMEGITSILMTTLLLSLTIAGIARQRRMPVGAFTVASLITAGAVCAATELTTWDIVIAYGLGGLLTDLLIRSLGDFARTRVGHVAVGAAFAAFCAGGYMLVTKARFGLNLEAEIWTGTIMWCAVLGGAVALASGKVVNRSHEPATVAAS
jgi:hypothetical protein